MSLSPKRALALVDAAYEATHARLASNDHYRALTASADEERKSTPHIWIARNRLALYVDINTPLFA